jgi:acyl-CoA reductase-like NAD-dependent aldehyde dehydrogenase
MPLPATSPVDGSAIAGPPMLPAEAAEEAVRAAMAEHRVWRETALPERAARVTAALDALTEHRDLLAMLLVWEIGKPWRTARADVDRCIDGVRWYVEEIGPMVEGRAPLDGPVSNIASWNYLLIAPHYPAIIRVRAGGRAAAP